MHPGAGSFTSLTAVSIDGTSRTPHLSNTRTALGSFNMRTKPLLGSMLLLTISVFGQMAPAKKPFPTDNRPLTGEEWRLELVTHLTTFPSPVTNGAVQLHGMGDEAAVDVIKAFSDKTDLTDADASAALDIVHLAFEKPDSIIEPVNRKPRAALFLLRWLSAMSVSDTVKIRIADETAFLKSQAIQKSAGGYNSGESAIERYGADDRN